MCDRQLAHALKLKTQWSDEANAAMKALGSALTSAAQLIHVYASRHFVLRALLSSHDKDKFTAADAALRDSMLVRGSTKMLAPDVAVITNTLMHHHKPLYVCSQLMKSI